MARCPICDSPNVYRRTGILRSRLFYCRECRRDLIARPGTNGVKACIFGAWLVAETLAILIARVRDPVLLIGGSVLFLATSLWLSDEFAGNLQLLDESHSSLTSRDAARARRAWFALRSPEIEQKSDGINPGA